MLNIPQFDILTLGAQIFGLLSTLALFFYYSIHTVIPNYAETKKFRVKKLTKNTKSISIMSLDLKNNKKLINSRYKLIVQ